MGTIQLIESKLKSRDEIIALETQKKMEINSKMDLIKKKYT